MAGGGAMPEVDNGGKKSVDFQLNLVPFIDLLSVLISFLLMTSVWTQVSMIDVKQRPNLPGSHMPPKEQPMENLNLTVIIKASGYTVSEKGVEVRTIEKKGDAYDATALGAVLRDRVAEHPENHKINVSSEDNIAYQELITVLDLCLDQKLDGISVIGIDS